MKLLSLLPTIGLLLIAIILVSVVLACTPSKTVGNQQEEMQHDRHHEADAGNVVHRSIELSSDGYKAMSDLANGIQNRGIGECLILNIDGFNYNGEEQVAIYIFLIKKETNNTNTKK